MVSDRLYLRDYIGPFLGLVEPLKRIINFMYQLVRLAQVADIEVQEDGSVIISHESGSRVAITAKGSIIQESTKHSVIRSGPGAYIDLNPQEIERYYDAYSKH